MKRKHLFIVFFFLMGCRSSGKYPAIGSIERLDPLLDSIILPGAEMEILAKGFEWSEGPVWIEKDSMLLFSDIPPNTIFKWTEKFGIQKYLIPSGYTGALKRGGEMGSNGLLLDSDGHLVLCQHGDRRMARMNAALDSPRPEFITLADSYQGKKLNSPNDAVFRSNGSLYFTDPPYGLEKQTEDPNRELNFQGVYCVSGGQLKLLIDSITRPNGIAFTPGEKYLFIANSDPEKPFWYRYEVKPGDSLANGILFFDAKPFKGPSVKGGPDGMKIDRAGFIFATAPGGVFILSKEGKLIGRLQIPEACSNIALADDDKTLFITADMYLIRLKMRP